MIGFLGVAISVSIAILAIGRAQAAELCVEIRNEGSKTRNGGRNEGVAEFDLCPYDEDGFGEGRVQDSIGFIEVCKAERYGDDNADTLLARLHFHPTLAVLPDRILTQDGKQMRSPQ